MADYVCSVDPGNGGTNAVLAKTNGRYKSVYFPSVRAAATGESLGLDAGMELQFEYVDWNGHRYVIGDDVVRVTRRHLERHMGTNRYGNEFHQMLVAVALAKLGIKKGVIDLTLFAPPGMYLEAKQTLLECFGGEAPTTIKLKGDAKPRSWVYNPVNVFPEGIGAVSCFIFDEHGTPTNTDLLTGEVIVLDLGAYTLDALKFVDGNFNAEELSHATWENGGINDHIREPVLRILKKRSDDFVRASVDDVDLTIRSGLEADDYTFRMAGLEVDIEPLINKHRERYAEWVANNIIDNVFNGLRGIKSLILVGGGATLIEDHLQEWYGDKVFNRKKHAITKNIHPVDFNCVGGLRLAQMRLQQQ